MKIVCKAVSERLLAVHSTQLEVKGCKPREIGNKCENDHFQWKTFVPENGDFLAKIADFHENQVSKTQKIEGGAKFFFTQRHLI